ncbi:MAG: flippase [Bdellovibrionota bacterium]
MNKEASILKNLSVMTLSVGVTQIIALVLKMLMPRIFGPEKMGIFFFAESFSSLFFAFLPLGLSTYISRTLPPKPDHVKDILWTVLWVQAVTALIIGAALYGALVWQGRDHETIMITLIMGGYAALFTFQKDILQKIYVILGEVVMISRLNVLVKLILVAGSVVILFTAPSIAWIAAMHLISEAFSFLYLLRLANKSDFIRATRKAPYLFPMLKVSLPFYLAGVLNGVYAQIDIFMLSQYANKVEVGYFGSAFKIIGICLFLIPVFQNAITPALSKALAENLDLFTAMVKDFMRTLMIASLPLAVGLTLFGDVISSILNGPEFAPAYRTVAFLTPVLVMMYLNTFMGASLYLASSGKKLSIIFITGGLLNLGLDYFLIPWGLTKYGPGGAGLAISFATFLCELYVFCVMLYMLPQRVISARLVLNGLLIFLPCWLGIYYHDWVASVSIPSRIGLFLLVVPYAFVTAMVTKADVARVLSVLPFNKSK